jgi:hypothetical protein
LANIRRTADDTWLAGLQTVVTIRFRFASVPRDGEDAEGRGWERRRLQQACAREPVAADLSTEDPDSRVDLL